MFGGMILYLRASEPARPHAKYGMPLFGAFMLLLQGSVFFGPALTSPQATAITALAGYVILAGGIHWLEKQRRPVPYA